jgi:16S rRNA processing protein RimM
VRRVTLAAVVGAHGVQGEVRLKLFAESIDSLRRHRSVEVGDRSLTLVGVKDAKEPIARFAEIEDRSDAEGLRGQLVTVPRSALPQLEDGEYYHIDLIGLGCVDASGAALGKVVAIENFGAGDLLEIEANDGKRALVPFKPGIADLSGDTIRVDPAFLV